MWPRRASFLLALCLWVSGCAGASDATRDTGVQAEILDEDRGAVVGLVTDDSLVPLADVLLRLDGSLEAVSGLDGSFVFSLLEPGTYQLAAQHPGYAQAVQDVQVEAGQTTQVSFRLVPLSTAAAFHETKILSGLVGCGASVRSPGGSQRPAVCGVGSLTPVNFDALNRHINEWNLGAPQDAWVGFWVETSWKSTQALGAGLYVTWNVANSPTGTAARTSLQLRAIEGASPLRSSLPIEEVRNATGDAVGGGATYCTSTCILWGGHFSSPRALGNPTADIGATVQQRFDDFFTVFHHGSLPAEFTALPDA